jgi:uncharacterized protein YlzI (FlbEa/FlbD family)
MKKAIVFIILILTFVSLPIKAKTPIEEVIEKYKQYENQKTPIRVIDHSENELGEILVYKIKKLIKDSGSMYLVNDNTIERIDILCKTMDYDNTSTATIYTIIWIYGSQEQFTYLDSTFGYVGYQRLDDAVNDIIDQTNKTILQLKELIGETE